MSIIIGIAGRARLPVEAAHGSLRTPGCQSCAPWAPVPGSASNCTSPGANAVFDENGALIDDLVRRLLTEFMAGFAEFVAPRR